MSENASNVCGSYLVTDKVHDKIKLILKMGTYILKIINVTICV